MKSVGALVLLLAVALSGCSVVGAAADVTSTAVGVGADAVGTAADTGAAVVRGAAHTVAGSDTQSAAAH